MNVIASVEVADLRFPTSLGLHGSDAMNPDPDYSAATLRLLTSDADLVGHGFVFTIGRGNDIQANAVEAVARRLVGRSVDGICEDVGSAAHDLLWDSQLRWLGPDKGVMHMAIGAVVNAMWDLRARREQRPLWSSLAALTPEEIVAQVDWTYLGDFLDPGEARELLEDRMRRRPERQSTLDTYGLAAYTTGPGWLGYTDELLETLCRKALDDGFQLIKLKVGSDLADDHRRLSVAREIVGPDIGIAVDANQRWSVDEAVAWVGELSRYDLRWVEEPTHPDDVMGHATIARAIAPVPVATGEHLANPVLAKQLLQHRGASILQLDATRVGGLNEQIAMTLLAARADVDMIPHAGGIGLCEAVQHLAFFNAIALAPRPDALALEHVDHLHEHMATPVEVIDARYRLPTAPGNGMAFAESTFKTHRFPDGSVWADPAGA